MFNKSWFLHHQKLLVWFANTWIGKKVLRYGLDRVDAILPNVVFKKQSKKYIAEFRTHNKYSKRIFYAFKPFWYLLHLWDMFWYPRFNLGFDTLTKYPDADPETTTVDGPMRAGPNGVYSTVHDASASGSALPSTPNGASYFVENGRFPTGSGDFTITRSILLFDTSSLTTNATISVAILSIYGAGTLDDVDGNDSAQIYTSTPASNTDIITGDYDQIGTTGQTTSGVDLGSWNTAAYNDFTFNATGIGNISKTSISKFGARTVLDAANTAPNGLNRVNAYFADQTGTTNDPKLVITYTSGGNLDLTSKMW